MFKTIATISAIVIASMTLIACDHTRPTCNSFCNELSTTEYIIFFDDDGNEIGRERRIGGWSPFN